MLVAEPANQWLHLFRGKGLLKQFQSLLLVTVSIV